MSEKDKKIEKERRGQVDKILASSKENSGERKVVFYI